MRVFDQCEFFLYLVLNEKAIIRITLQWRTLSSLVKHAGLTFVKS